MEELKKHKLALIFIAALLVFKFILIPVIDWQNTKIAEIKLQERKLLKMTGLMLGEKELEDKNERLTNALRAINQSLYPTMNTEAFKRQQQIEIESNLKAQELKIANIGWQTVSELKGTPLTQYSVTYSFKGTGEAVINYLLSISASDKYSQFQVVNISISKQRKGRLGYFSVRLQRLFYMSSLTDKSYWNTEQTIGENLITESEKGE